jgi:hypothetical protein
MISESEAAAAMKVAIDLGQQVITWLKENHPELMTMTNR